MLVLVLVLFAMKIYFVLSTKFEMSTKFVITPLFKPSANLNSVQNWIKYKFRFSIKE